MPAFQSMTLHQAQAWRAPQAGDLKVLQGQVWITRAGDLSDHVLQAGETLHVQRGEQLAAGPWDAGQPAQLAWQAQPALQPLARLRADAGLGFAAGARFLAGGLLALARSAEASASRAHGSI